MVQFEHHASAPGLELRHADLFQEAVAHIEALASSLGSSFVFSRSKKMRSGLSIRCDSYLTPPPDRSQRACSLAWTSGGFREPARACRSRLRRARCLPRLHCLSSSLELRLARRCPCQVSGSELGLGLESLMLPSPPFDFRLACCCRFGQGMARCVSELVAGIAAQEFLEGRVGTQSCREGLPYRFRQSGTARRSGTCCRDTRGEEIRTAGWPTQNVWVIEASAHFLGHLGSGNHARVGAA